MRFLGTKRYRLWARGGKVPPFPSAFRLTLASVRLTARHVCSTKSEERSTMRAFTTATINPKIQIYFFFLNMSLCSCTQMYLIRHSGRQARRLSRKQAFHWKFVLTHRCRTLVSVVVSGDFCRFKLSFPSLLFLSKDF